MSVTFTDDDLQSWEAYATGGDYGLANNPKVVFNCVSDPTRRPRYLEFTGDEADAEGLVSETSIPQLRAMLKESAELP
jgi:hypothetical protein